MRFRSVGSGIKLIKTDYKSASLLLASEKIVKEYVAIKVKDDIYLMNDDNIDYFCVIDKTGLGRLGGATMRVLLGPIGHAVAKTVMGGGFFDGKTKLVFIKLNNEKRILVQVEDGYMHLIRSRNKVSSSKIGENDERWILNVLEKIIGKDRANHQEIVDDFALEEDDLI